MKRLQQLKWILILFFAILTIQSCEKDDVLIDGDSVTDTTGTDGNDNTNGDNNGNDNSNGDTNGDQGDNSGTDGEEGEITLYKVDGANITKKTDYKVTGADLELQKDTNKHQEVWELVKKIVPTSYLSKMSEFMIFSGESSGTAGCISYGKWVLP